MFYLSHWKQTFKYMWYAFGCGSVNLWKLFYCWLYWLHFNASAVVITDKQIRLFIMLIILSWFEEYISVESWLLAADTLSKSIAISEAFCSSAVLLSPSSIISLSLTQCLILLQYSVADARCCRITKPTRTPIHLLQPLQQIGLIKNIRQNGSILKTIKRRFDIRCFL